MFVCVWPWLTGRCCSALQPIPSGPSPCCLFSDLDSLSLSLWVALPPPSLFLLTPLFFSPTSLMSFSLPPPLFPSPSDLLSSLFLLLSRSFLFAPCSATLTAFFHPSRTNHLCSPSVLLSLSHSSPSSQWLHSFSFSSSILLPLVYPTLLFTTNS